MPARLGSYLKSEALQCFHSVRLKPHLSYDNDLDQISVFASMPTSLLHSQLKHSRFLSLLIRLSVYQTQASLPDILITFVKTFSFNLVVRLVCFAFVSRVIKLDLLEATCVEIPVNIRLGWKWVTVSKVGVFYFFLSRVIKLDLFEATCVEIPLNIILGWKWVTVWLLCYAKKFYSACPSKEIGNFGWNLLLRRLKILPLNFKHFQL